MQSSRSQFSNSQSSNSQASSYNSIAHDQDMPFIANGQPVSPEPYGLVMTIWQDTDPAAEPSDLALLVGEARVRQSAYPNYLTAWMHDVIPGLPPMQRGLGFEVQNFVWDRFQILTKVEPDRDSLRHIQFNSEQDADINLATYHWTKATLAKLLAQTDAFEPGYTSLLSLAASKGINVPDFFIRNHAGLLVNYENRHLFCYVGIVHAALREAHNEVDDDILEGWSDWIRYTSDAILRYAQQPFADLAAIHRAASVVCLEYKRQNLPLTLIDSESGVMSSLGLEIDVRLLVATAAYVWTHLTARRWIMESFEREIARLEALKEGET